MSGDAKESVRLDAVYINRWKLNSRDVFTIDEAAQYWAGYAQFMPGDNKAQFEYNDIFNMLYLAFEEGDLELCELVEHDWFLLTARPVFARSGIDYNFGWCKVDRDSLVELALKVNEYPLFLFPDGVPKEKNNNYDGGSRKEQASKKKYALLMEAQCLLNNADNLTAYQNGFKLNGAAIALALCPGQNHTKTGYAFGQVERVIRKAITEGTISLPGKQNSSC